MDNPLYDERLLGGRCEYFERVDSTNLRAKELARMGAKHLSVVLADEQTAGRGRRGRGWLSRPGVGAWMSVILRPENLPQSRSPEIVFPTAVAMAEALTEAAGTGARVKWPNDIVMDGRKVSGMLLEACADGGQTAWVVAGIGVNILGRDFPEDMPYAGSVESITGVTLSRAAFVARFLTIFDARYAAWEKGGLPAVMPDYRRLSVTLGAMVRAQTPTGEVTGRAVDVRDDGALAVVDAEGNKLILHAGDVSVRGIMGYA